MGGCCNRAEGGASGASDLLLFHADPQVRLVELVWDVPAQSSELPPLLHHGVEETEPKEELPPGLWLGEVRGRSEGGGKGRLAEEVPTSSLADLVATFKEIGVRDGIIEVGAKEVGPHSLRRLVGHLHS